MKKRLENLSLEKLLLTISVAISLLATTYFYLHSQQNLADYDAIARLNIARKVTDSLTPGLGQLGGIWLPIPQVFMVPLVMNDFLWRSGLAGAMVSGVAFVVGAVFLFKTMLQIANNKAVACFVWLAYVTNVNILLLQSMAMSEVSFLSAFIMVLYFLIRWVKNHQLMDLFATGIFVVLITLTRYEGYFVFIAATLTIAVDAMSAFWKKEGLTKVEGILVLFITLASFGILVWCLYCFLVFKDPLFWLHLYSASADQFALPNQAAKNVLAASTSGNVVRQTPLSALLAYCGAILWTNGFLTVFAALLGLALALANVVRNGAKREGSVYLWPLIISTVVLFGFLIFGYFKGFIPNIEYPPINWATLQNKAFNNYSHSNIRYGVMLAPCLLLLIGFAASRKKVLGLAVALVFACQIVTTFTTPYFLFFSFPKSWGYSILAPIPWFRSHYQGGKILISANRHENFMFQTNLVYRSFIYEGSQQYWQGSLDQPDKYAQWVVYEIAEGDKVYELLTPHAREVLSQHYSLAYQDKTFRIYHLQGAL